MINQVKVVLLEYSKEQKRVIVRGVWNKYQEKRLEKLSPENEQNYVSVFEGVDMGWHAGFTGLIPDNKQEKKK